MGFGRTGGLAKLRGVFGAACLAILGTHCTSAPRGDNAPSEDVADGQGRACAAGDPVGRGALRASVEALAAPALAGREPGTAGDRAARAMVQERFECLGLEAPGGAHQQPFSTEEGAPTANVIGILRGRDPAVADELVVIGAHHDHLGEGAGGIFAGANDNASGLALLMGLAESLASRGTRRTVVFAAFGAEELGYLGSQHFVDQPPGDLVIEDVVFMINLDMVGRYGDEGFLNALHTFDGTPGRTVLEGMVGDFPDLEVGLGEPGVEADHLSFCAAGVPVTFFFTEDTECYHQTCDTPDQLDYPGLERVAALVTAFAAELSDTSLDLAAARQRGCGQ